MWELKLMARAPDLVQNHDGDQQLLHWVLA
jgi:hypothetical protein